MSPKVIMEIIIPDMGHGNCIWFSDIQRNPFLIDCGSKDKLKEPNFDNHVFSAITNVTESDLAITHYHFDHYNMIRKFTDYHFNTIFVPALPRTSFTGQLLFKMLSIFSVFSYRDYDLSVEILRKTRNVEALVTNDKFQAFGIEWDVIWPDYSIIDRIHKSFLTKVKIEIDEIIEELTEEERHQLDQVMELLNGLRSQEKTEYDKPIERITEVSPVIIEKIKAIEKKFRYLANRTSLVFNDENGNYLFTGDVDSTCLNKHIIFPYTKYVVTEASHHGTMYGSAFDNLYTCFLIVSRNAKNIVKSGYYRNVNWKIFLDTSKLGNCILVPPSSLNYDL